MDANENQLSVSDLLEAGKMSWSLLTKWEKNFLSDIDKKFISKSSISPKQENCLRKIITRVQEELERTHAFSEYQIAHFKKLKGLK